MSIRRTEASLRAPARLLLIRHGESAGNVARQRAYDRRAAVIEVAERDMDVALSDLGREQARDLGRWLRTVDEAQQPTAVLSSPYARAEQTALLALAECGGAVGALPVRLDERLRDRDFGVLDRLTGRGITERHPEQAELRARLGRFYHRPPGGESWTDVLLRLRSVQVTLAAEYAGENVVVFAHDIVVKCFRYLLEGLTEREVLTLSDTTEIANCSLTSYRFGPGGASLTRFNVVATRGPSEAPGAREPAPGSPTPRGWLT